MDATLENLENIIPSNCSINEDQVAVLQYLIKKTIEKTGLSAKAASIIVALQHLIAKQGLVGEIRPSQQISSQLQDYLKVSDTLFPENSDIWNSNEMKAIAEELMRATETYIKELTKLIDGESDPCNQIVVFSSEVLVGMVKLEKNCLEYDSQGKATSDLIMPQENATAPSLNENQPINSIRILATVFDALANAQEITISTVLYESLDTVLTQEMSEESKIQTNNTKVIVNSKVFGVTIEPQLPEEYIWGKDMVLEIRLQLIVKNLDSQNQLFCAYYKVDQYVCL